MTGTIENDSNFADKQLWKHFARKGAQVDTTLVYDWRAIAIVIAACVFIIVVSMIFAVKNHLCQYCTMYPPSMEKLVKAASKPSSTCKNCQKNINNKRTTDETDVIGLPTYTEALSLEQPTNSRADQACTSKVTVV